MSQDELEYEDEEFEDADFDKEDLDKEEFDDEDFDDQEADDDYQASYDDDDEGPYEDGDYYDDGPSDNGQDDYYSGSDDRDGRGNGRGGGRGRYRDEIYSKRVPAGKRTYFFDVKTTRSGKDYFLTITESKKVGENRYEKHKLFLYKEDFGKFVSAMHEVVRFIQDECLPDYEFRGLPDVSKQDGEQDDDWSDEDGSY